MIDVYVYGKKAQINEMNPSFNYHTGLDLPFIEITGIISDGEKKWKENFKVTNEQEAEKEIKEVIQFFNDTIKSHEKIRTFVRIYVEDEEVAKYKNGEGMSGWLNPEGKFFPYDFGEHSRYFHEVLQKEGLEMDDIALNQHIPMSNNEQSTFSFIGILKNITPQQEEWFNRFFDKLSPTQKISVVNKFNKQGLKLEYHW